MAHLFWIQKLLFLTFVIKAGQSQTVCTYRVPIPDLDICDASGGIEENINAGMFEMKGNINGMQDYQMDNFKLLDKQVNGVVKERGHIDTGISDISNELETLKRSLLNIQMSQIQLNPNGTASNSGRRKRAVSANSQLQQDLDAAKQAFQQSVQALDSQLRTLAQQVSNFEQQTAATHRRYLALLAQNQKDLMASESQLTNIAQAVQQLGQTSSALGSSATAADISQLRQDVADLLVDAKTAEKVTEREIDRLETRINNTEAIERSVQSDLQATTTSLNNTGTRISNIEQQTSRTTTAERIFGDLAGDLITNNTLDIANAKDLVTNTSAALAQLGQVVLNSTVKAGQMGRELTNVKQDLTGVQSLVAFSQGVSSTQSLELLSLRMNLIDDIHVLQYAFGARGIPP